MSNKNKDNKNIENFEVFPWNRNFETGQAEIDKQHMKLVALLNKLARTLVKSEMTEVDHAFSELADYADVHFADEEAFWSEYFSDDNWLNLHKLTHTSFLPGVMKIKEQSSEKNIADVIEDTVMFLIRWLTFHILDNDKRMAIAASEIKAGATLEEAKSIADEKMNGSMHSFIETILKMYDKLSSNAIELMRERNTRIHIEEELKEANKRLELLSITDQLTGLFNRRHFNLVFDQELRRAHREKKNLTFIEMDIDYFKLYNDNNGHLKGDAALEKVGETLQKACRRPDDFAFRIGGEEFAVISANLSVKKAIEFAEKIRLSINDLKIIHKNSKVDKYLTISAGIITKIPDMGDTAKDYMQIADARLYEAKDAGRNRVDYSS